MKSLPIDPVFSNWCNFIGLLERELNGFSPFYRLLLQILLVLVVTIKNEEKLCIRIFDAKSETTHNHRNGSSDISYSILFSRNLKDI